jgi:hypothetical protein
MKTRIVIAALLVLAATGCQRGGVALAPPINAAPMLAGQEGKDRAIISEAAKIDAIAPAAKPHTDAQRAAVAAAPAADVARIVAEFESKTKADAATIARLTKELNEARNKTDRVIRIGGYALAALLVALGAASFFLAAQVPWLGPRIGMALGASGASVFAMVQAYEWTKAHPWVTGLALLGIIIAAALAYANNFHANNGSTSSNV